MREEKNICRRFNEIKITNLQGKLKILILITVNVNRSQFEEHTEPQKTRTTRTFSFLQIWKRLYRIQQLSIETNCPIKGNFRHIFIGS